MMSDQISVCEFLSETTEDYNSPTTSSFTTRLQSCRNTVSILEEVLDQDRSALQKVKKSVKSIYSSGQEHAGNQESFSQALEKLGGNNCELGAAFIKFSCLVKELAGLLENLLQSLSHNVIFTLDSLLKGDLKGVKGDLKKPFDKAWKDYETKFTKIEKEKREHAKHCVCVQQYLIKVNEIKTKKGVDLLQNLIKYYHAQCSFFQDSLKTADNLKQYIEKLAADLHNIKWGQDEEKKQLTALRDVIKSSLQLDPREDSQSKQSGYSMHQLQGNKDFGSEKRGYLLKKSDGLRKVWQRRKCSVKSGVLTISHATSNRQPVKLNLLTCQMKPSAEDKKCFDLISYNRSYHFQAEDEQEFVSWVSVLTNNKEEALNMAFLGGSHSSGVKEDEGLTKSIIEEVLRTPGNNTCCDCGAADPHWLSTNLGILTCIECSGNHRDMGVHVSRIQSLELDKLGTSELLLARNVGNCSFNKIMEACLSCPSLKPTASSDMTVRKEFINAKYIDHKFVRRSVSSATSRLDELYEAVQSQDLLSIIQLFAEGVDLLQPLPEQGNVGWNLHLSVRISVRGGFSSFFRLYCCCFCCCCCCKLPVFVVISANQSGETALDIACRLKNPQCEEPLVESVSGRFNPHVHVEYDWSLRLDKLDESDDELDDKPSPVKRKHSLCPQSFCPSSSVSSQEKLSAPASFVPPHMDKQCLSYGAFATPAYSTSSDNSPSLGPDNSEPSPAARRQGKGRKTMCSRLVDPRMALRKIDTIYLPYVDKPNQTLDLLHKPCASPPRSHPDPQKSPPHIDASPKPPLTPKPQLSDLPPKPLLKDLPRKPQITDNPSKPQLGERPGSVAMEIQGSKMAAAVKRQLSVQQLESSPRLAAKDKDDSPPGAMEIPIPLPRKIDSVKRKICRVKTIYGCQADNNDELTFTEGQVIIVTGEEDQEWWVNCKGFGLAPLSKLTS
uniref:ArfGAP with SH3 domain, ankyrin repeat and PH domain 1b n=1 Tax=Anabas testudineus TaxID=64144 RepID=A0A7N6FAC3_ANATE